MDDPIPLTDSCLTKSLCAHYIGVDSQEQFMVIPQTKLWIPKENGFY